MSIQRILSTLKVEPHEARMAGAVALFFGLIELSRSAGGSAADALFFLRYGVEYLPIMFIALGIVTFAASLGYAAFLGRVARGRFLTSLLIMMGVVLLVERAAITFDLAALYPLLWLSVNLAASLLGTLIWNVAGEVCDTRQAKRLFPLFVSAGILGGLVGSVVIGPTARLLGTENLIVLEVILLAVAAVLMRHIARVYYPAIKQPLAASSFLSDIRAGSDYVRRSPLLQRVAISAVLFSILYFSVSFPFGRATSAAFSNEADLAGFLGLFQGVASALMFVAALLIANRLYARIGIVYSLLILPVTYLLGFAIFVINFTLGAVMIVRMALFVVLSGIGDGAYGAFFNVVPSEKRAQVRAFDSGVPSQIGVILSGILLILGNQVLDNTQIFIMGGVVAVVCAYVVWSMKRSYTDALIAALREGRVEVFTAGYRIFSGVHADAGAIGILTAALHDPKPSTQQLAVEMLSRMDAQGAQGPQQALPSMVDVLLRPDTDTRVRVSIIKALGQFSSPTTTGALIDLMNDPVFEVRVQAVINLVIDAGDAAAARQLAVTLHDPDLNIRLTALKALADTLNSDSGTRRSLPDSVVEALVQSMDETSAFCREAACRAIGGANRPSVLQALAKRLSDPELRVRTAAAHGLRDAGVSASPYVISLLITQKADPVAALAALTPSDPSIRAPMREYIQAQTQHLKTLQRLSADLPQSGRITGYLIVVLGQQAELLERRIVQALGLLSNPEAMALVAKGLRSSDGQTRASAIEALDVLGDAQLVKTILPLLEIASSNHRQSTSIENVLRETIDLPERWIKALAICAAGELNLQVMAPALRVYIEDGDTLIREAVRYMLAQLGEKMETLTTISLIERVLLLKDVPLFHELNSDDLGHVAELTTERWYANGTALCHQGDHGDELYIVASGSVRVTKQTNGVTRLLATRITGEFIGEMALIDSEPRAATLTAEGDVRTLVLSALSFRAILEERPEAAFVVMRVLSRRLREQT